MTVPQPLPEKRDCPYSRQRGQVCYPRACAAKGWCFQLGIRRCPVDENAERIIADKG